MMNCATPENVARVSRTLCRLACILAGLCWGLTAVVQADYRVLHHFAGGADDGATAYCSLIASGSVLYGMTYEGGGSNLGTVFRMNTDGTGFQVLHSFVGASTDGSTPVGGLLLSESTLYGMATSAGTPYRSTIFAMNTDGSGFQILHRFTTNEGKWPYGTLIGSGSMLYGLTGYGGSDNGSGWVGGGTMFRMNTNGSGFQVLHTFRLTSSDAWSPHGTLVQSGTHLYGATADGGINRGGTVFRSNLDGSGFELLHRFIGGSSDGLTPGDMSTLLVSGSTLYGMTYGTTRQGSIQNSGTIYCINTDGSGFRLLHMFAGGADDGAWPISGTLVRCGSTLYGMTPEGGPDNLGTVFRINTDGSGFQLLHRFTGQDGSRPYGSLLLSGSTLYGTTTEGGNSNLGVIFALDLSQMRLVPEHYATIQAAIDAAGPGDTIRVAPGTYAENILISGEDVTLRSSDANDPNVTALTILEGTGRDPVVSLQHRTSLCTVAGLTIRGGGTGIWCFAGEPAIRGCRIVENVGPGIELLSNAKPAIEHCIIAANGSVGVEMPRASGRAGIIDAPALVNCTIAQNAAGGMSGGRPVLRNCIVYSNGAEQAGPQISPTGSQVTYSCIQGGYTGTENMNADPLFVRLGRWTNTNDINQPVPVWLPGDYHLRSRAGCWDPNSCTWVRDELTSRCIDAGSPADAVGSEPVPHGGRINMGAYGGTAQASRSPVVQLEDTGQPFSRLAGLGVSLADFNGDGFLDAFVVNQDTQDGQGNRVYLNDGSARFTDSGQRLANPSGFFGKPGVVDVDGDGAVDVITGRTIWLNDGLGHFSASTGRFVDSDGAAFFRVALVDLNGDARPDVFVTFTDGPSRVYLSDDNGRFADSGQRLGGGTIYQAVLGDLNGDGIVDAVTTGWRPSSMGGTSTYCPNRVWLNDGNGRFTDIGQVLDEGNRHVHGTALGDVDGDGALDLVVGMTQDPWARVYHNDGHGRFTAAQTFGAGWIESLAMGDLNADGSPDVLVSSGYGSRPGEVWINDGHGSLRNGGLSLSVAVDAAMGDLNGDGRLDVFVVDVDQTGLAPRGRPAKVYLNTTPALSLPDRSPVTD